MGSIIVPQIFFKNTQKHGSNYLSHLLSTYIIPALLPGCPDANMDSCSGILGTMMIAPHQAAVLYYDTEWVGAVQGLTPPSAVSQQPMESTSALMSPCTVCAARQALEQGLSCGQEPRDRSHCRHWVDLALWSGLNLTSTGCELADH